MRNRILGLQKISWKLTWIYSILFSGVLLLLSAGVLYGVRYYLLDQAYASVRSTAKETVSMILDTKNGKMNLADEELLSEAQQDSDINIVIADANGKIINNADNYQITDNDLLFRPGVIRRIGNNGRRLMILNSSVMDGTKKVAIAQVAYSLEKSYRFINILFILLASSDALGILSSILVGYFLSQRMLKPIDKITKTAQTISINDLASRIPVGNADDEITRLAVTFNDMLDRLKDSIDRQSRFVSDASHELRTPISVISGYVNLLDRWGKDDIKVLQESVDAIKTEATGMRELIEKLLFLARNDSGKMIINKEPFDVVELLQDIADESKLIAPQIEFSIVSNERLMLNADPKMIKQLLRILIDNSIKFTKINGKIGLHAATSDENIRIMVTDNGIGVPSEEVCHIFDRFYRVDKARAKDTGGSGLGLSIAKSISDIHNGDIYMESSPGNGTCVTVVLPQA
jgi:two-component system, OmpR family, sensor histidine kinase ArlS